MTTPAWAASPEEVVGEVVTDDERGLSSQDADARLARDGPNEIAGAPPTPWWRRLFAQFQDPLVALLLVAIVISLLAWWSEGAEGAPLDAIVIAAIVALNAGIGYWQEVKADAAVAALARLGATHATVLRDGRPVHVPTTELVVGDIVALSEGDAVGADCRLLRSAALSVSEAALTGESTPVDKHPDVVDADSPLAARTNMVFGGTAVVRGRGEAVVVATGMRSEIGQIAAMLGQGPPEETPLQREIAWLGRRLGVTVVVLAAVVVAAVLATSADRSFTGSIDALLVGVSLAVAAVPEGLPAILSVVLALGVQRMARANAIVKRLSSVETLGSATVICTDKTGTLTRNEMTIVRVVTGAGTVDLTGVGYEPVGHPTIGGRDVDDDRLLRDVALVVSAGSLANDADLRHEGGAWSIIGDPTEAAFLVAEEKMGAATERKRRFDRLAEIPFTSERKRMSTLHSDVDREHAGPVLVVKGAPDVVLARCSHERIRGRTIALTAERRAELVAEVDDLADRALRTLAVAYRRFGDDVRGDIDERHEDGLVHLGVVGILDPPREEATQAIADATRAGIEVVMITGDHPRTAARIAELLAFPGAARGAVTGAELDAMEPDDRDEAIRSRRVFARVEPEHKLRIVEVLQADGHVVAMTGDGVNDAPALQRADIGVAMGINGTEVSKEASDMILADDHVATIVVAVREGREIFSDIRKVVRYLLASNTGEVLAVLVGVIAAGLIGLRTGGSTAVPLLATQILWINLLTDGALALALGVDPPVDDLLGRPPRSPNERVIDHRMVTTIVLLGVTAAVAALIALDLRLPGGLVGDTGDLETARTMAFTTLVLAQICNAFNARSDRVSAFHHIATNRWLWFSIAVTIGLQASVVHVPALQDAFSTASLGLDEWLWCAGLGSTVLWVDEVRKLIARRTLVAAAVPDRVRHAPGERAPDQIAVR